MKIKFALLLAAVALQAAPVLLPDGVPVDPNDPHIGAYVWAVPGTKWVVGGEDCPPGLTCGLKDMNDAMANIELDGLTGTATSLGGTSNWLNYFLVKGQPVLLDHPITFDAVLGERIAITLVTGYGATYDIGTQQVYAALVHEHGPLHPVPEPAGSFMIAAGLALTWKWRRR